MMGEGRRDQVMSVRSMAVSALMVSLMAVSAWIVIPSAVPFTMQTFVVFVCAGMLGGKRSARVVITYILIGMAGVPVFASFSGGVAQVVGPTGGYIIGFVFAAMISGILMEKLGRKTLAMAFSMALGLLWCVIPFVIPDAVKICLAVSLVKVMKPQTETFLR